MGSNIVAMGKNSTVCSLLLVATGLVGCQSLANKPVTSAEPTGETLTALAKAPKNPRHDNTAPTVLRLSSDEAVSLRSTPANLATAVSARPALTKAADHSTKADPLQDDNQYAAAGDLWQLTRSHFGLNLDNDDPRVIAQLNWYKKHPHYLKRVTARAERYYYHVIHQVLERNMPAEIALLPIVESAYDPFAYSHGRAAGPWQFIPGTARHFGLKKTWWYDGRRDIQASTDAALTYLNQLQQRFDGDWELALAGYNAGGGNVSKAIRKNKKANKPIRFWDLPLPKETRAYVPKLIALAKIFKAPEEYGITLTPIANRPYFHAVDVGSQIDLAQAAELADISIDELYLLNPGFNQWATDPSGPHQLLVPAEQAQRFQQALADLPSNQRVSWQRYRIRPGDSLINIAKSNSTTVEALKTANSLRSNLIRSGQTLLIPTASKNAKAYALSSDQRQVKKSQRIALRSGKQKTTHKVSSGDSFWSLAQHYRVGVKELASWNQMAPGDPLAIGKQLVIWQAGDTQTLASNDSRNIVRKIGYRVRSGDSLSRIASRFNVKITDIQRWNTLKSAKYLQPGQQLTLYVDVTRAH